MLSFLLEQLHHHLARSPRWQLLVTSRVLVAMIGIGYLFPFSALTQPIDYWNIIFRSPSPMGFEMDFYITTIFMWTNLIALGIVVFLLPIPSFSNSSRSGVGKVVENRIVYGYIGQMVCLLLVPLCHVLRFGLYQKHYRRGVSDSMYLANNAPSDNNLMTMTKETPPDIMLNVVTITKTGRSEGLLTEQSHFYLVLCITACTAIATAWIDSVAISFISQYPTVLQESFQLGIGLSTLIGSIYRIFTKLMFPSHAIVASTFLYFFFGSFTIFMCIIGFKLLLNVSDLIKQPLPLDSEHPTVIQTPTTMVVTSSDERGAIQSGISSTQYRTARFSFDDAGSDDITSKAQNQLHRDSEVEQQHWNHRRGCGERFSMLENSSNHSITTSSSNTAIPMMKKSVTFDMLDEVKDEESIPLFRQQFQRERAYSSIQINLSGNNSLDRSDVGIDDERSTSFSDRDSDDDSLTWNDDTKRMFGNTFAFRWQVFKTVGFNEFIIFFIFASTLVIWPAGIAKIQNKSYPTWNIENWWQLLLLLMFSLADCTGRLCTSWRLCINSSTIWIPSMFRLLLLPPIIAMIEGIDFATDLYYCSVIVLYAWTYGYLGSLAVILVNEMHSDEEQEKKMIAGGFTGFFLNFGLVIGATIAMFFARWGWL